MALGHWLKDYIGPHSGGSGDGGGVFVINGTIDGNHMTLDHTWQEIYDARAAVLVFEDETGYLFNSQLISCGVEDNIYGCSFGRFGEASALEFSTDSPNGYPGKVLE